MLRVGQCQISNEKKHLEDTQTLSAGCNKTEPKNFAPPQRRRPPSQGRRTAKILSAGDGHYLYLQTQFGEDRCTQCLVIVVTDPPTNTRNHKSSIFGNTVWQLVSN